MQQANQRVTVKWSLLECILKHLHLNYLKFLYLFFRQTFEFPYSLITNELYGFISKSYFHVLGSRLTNIRICFDPTFNLSWGIILFVRFLRYLKDAIVALNKHFGKDICLLVLELVFRQF